MTRVLALSVLLLAAPLAGAAQAQTAAAASASVGLEIQDGVQISTLERPTVAVEGGETVVPSTTSILDTTTVIQISGDPGRAYRIRLPRFATAEVRGLVRGVGATDDETATAMSLEGRDVIRVRGRMWLSEAQAGGGAPIPLSIEVE
ncbi:MAG: hypothetical protein BGN86_10225 [Caulobacterales bacterium 68-7]|nr:MAG: hypothetical protein BGN86_10225 [Caulobacterales bacterium 68-7]